MATASERGPRGDTPDDAFLDAALLVARRAADAAEAVIARWYRRGVDVELKPDESPVTVVDRECERAILDVLRAAYPDHAVYGEEFGRVDTGSDFLWLVDPIDGTKSFVRDQPFFSVQVALMHRGALVLGVSSARQYGEVAWARRGGGAYVQTLENFDPAKPARALAAPARMRCSDCDAIERAMFSMGNVKTLARGALDFVIETDVNILDIAPLVVILREAGATFTDFEGREIGLATTSVLAAPPALHGKVLAHFRG